MAEVKSLMERAGENDKELNIPIGVSLFKLQSLSPNFAGRPFA